VAVQGFDEVVEEAEHLAWFGLGQGDRATDDGHLPVFVLLARGVRRLVFPFNAFQLDRRHPFKRLADQAERRPRLALQAAQLAVAGGQLA